MAAFSLPEPQLDPLLSMIAKYRDDPRAHKIDLGVGVYRDETGATTVLDAVKTAEAQLHRQQQSKSYLGLTGDVSFIDNLANVVFGAAEERGGRTVAGAQTPGGSGGLRLAAETFHAAFPKNSIWISDPSWPNHEPIFIAGGAPVKHYPYFDVGNQTLLFERTLDTLKQASAGDAVLLHGCCHNPSGADPDRSQWQQLTQLIVERELVPIVDLAYHGFGHGMDDDLYAARLIANRCEQTLVAVSASKNFGLYRDRTGAVYISASDAGIAHRSQGYFAQIARRTYSMPPDHGAAVVDLILADSTLKQNWMNELRTMMTRIRSVRRAMAEQGALLGLDFIQHQNGLFSLLPVTPQQVDALVDEQAVYIAGDGRINVAGCSLAQVPQFIEALSAVGFDAR